MRAGLLLLPPLLGAIAVAAALPAVDAKRQARAELETARLVPDPAQVRAVASGFEEPLADLIWMRAVLLFGGAYGQESGDAWGEALHRMIDAVITLDPDWRTAPYYGGVLLRVSGAVERADAVFLRGAENLPEEPFFPFSIGMDAYLYRDDAATAAEWLERAAVLPGAPAWYAASAAAMRQRAGQREAGIRYLRELRDSATEPAIRAETERQLARLEHNALVDGWADACRDHRARTGRPLPAPEALAALGIDLPPNPRGDAWVVGGDGVVRGAAAEEERLRKLRGQEFALLRR